MGKSIGRFLVSFAVLVAAGVALILLMPGAIQGSSDLPIWVFAALGAIALASAFYARRVKPNRDS